MTRGALSRFFRDRIRYWEGRLRLRRFGAYERARAIEDAGLGTHHATDWDPDWSALFDAGVGYEGPRGKSREWGDEDEE